MIPDKSAAGRYAEAYYKDTGREVRIFADRARRVNLVEEPYVDWLESRLAYEMSDGKYRERVMPDGRTHDQFLHDLYADDPEK